MSNLNYITNEETLLQPHETTISIEAWLGDCKYIEDKNYEGCYHISFLPNTDADYLRLEEQIEHAVTLVEMRKDCYSRKIPTASCKNKDGSFYTSQLFQPKCNVEYHRPTDLNGYLASLKLHLREDPDGNVLLQAEWVDLYQQVKPELMTPIKTQFEIEMEQNPSLPPDDFDW